jgi:hypothetical protein
MTYDQWKTTDPRHRWATWLERAGAVFAGASIAFALTALLFPELLRWLL